MASLDSLPPDQRAVLQLVLKRGRSYDEIASLLSIDRAAVRQRALDALDTLAQQHDGPAPAERALITDYLLGQLPGRVAEQVHGLLQASANENTWAHTVAGELTELSGSLPELPPLREAGADLPTPASIPEPVTPTEPADLPEPLSAVAEDVAAAEPSGVQDAAEHDATAAHPTAEAEHDDEHWDDEHWDDEHGVYWDEEHHDDAATAKKPASAAPRPSRTRPTGSRRSGAVLLAAGAAVVLLAVIVIALTGGGGKTPSTGAGKHHGTGTGQDKTKTNTTPRGKYLAQINLTSPDGTGAEGIAQVVRLENVTGVVIDAKGVPANTRHNAYAVWLANSEHDAKFIGFVNKLVGKDGAFETEGPLPSNATDYSKLLITLETAAHPKQPGTVVLSGPFTESKS